jgi:hypothetical protein
MICRFSRKHAIALTAVLAGLAWLAVPGRNMYGNPSMEEEQSSCSLGNGQVLRLYKGGGDATVDFWYTVTEEGGLFERGKQIVFSHGSPILSSLSCEESRVHIDGNTVSLLLSPEDISALRRSPRQYWKGKLESGS